MYVKLLRSLFNAENFVCRLSLAILVQFIFTSAKEVMFLPDFVRLSVWLCVSKITQKVMDGFFRNSDGMSGMAQTTSDSVLEVIWKESWILDHFEIFVTIAFNGA